MNGGSDPVRLHFIEALAQRAGQHEGPVRQLLEHRLAELRAAYHRDAQAACTPCSGLTETPPARSALAELVERLQRHASTAQASAAAPTDPNTLQYFRRTWSRLAANQRLTQALAKVPENAGPLNSHHLVHRALSLMRELSPEYLARFIEHVDALMWLEQATAPRATRAPSR